MRAAIVALLGQLAAHLSKRDVAALVRTLSDSAPLVSVAATAALEHVGASALGPLLETLREGTASAPRCRVAWLVGRLGERAGSNAARALLHAAADPDECVRHAAADALAQIAMWIPDHAADTLVGWRAGSEDPLLRAAATQALRGMGERIPGTAVDALVAALGDADARVRSAAAMALNELGDRVADAAAGAFVQALAAEPWLVVNGAAVERWTAAERLSDRGLALVLLALRTGDPRARQAATRVLAALGAAPGRWSDQSVQALLEAADDAAVDIRLTTIKALGNRLGDRDEEQRMYPLLLATLVRAAGDEDWRVREAALQALGREPAARLGDAGGRALVSGLQDITWQVRAAAAHALGTLGVPAPSDAVSALAAAQLDPHLRVGIPVARALAALGQPVSEQAVAMLVAAACGHDDLDAATQTDELQALLVVLGQQVIGPLVAQAARHDEWRRRQTAMQLLGALEIPLPDDAVHALLQALGERDQQSSIAQSAARALHHLVRTRRVPQQALQPIVMALARHDSALTAVAQEICGQLERFSPIRHPFAPPPSLRAHTRLVREQPASPG